MAANRAHDSKFCLHTAKLPYRLSIKVHEDVADFIHGTVIGMMLGLILGLFLKKLF